MATDFFSNYLLYASNNEAPAFFHRWAAITGLGAYLGRDIYFQHGHFEVTPNIYCMLMGSPGTRKSTSIKLIKHVLKLAGYTNMAAEKTSKEKFLMDLAGDSDSEEKDILESNIFGDEEDGVRECFIAADEFNDFIGNGNIEFISLLGSLWDYSGVYKNRIKTGKSVAIPNPTISILGGNTPTGFSLAFPPEVIGQGFFSRLLLVYGEPTGKQITFPKPPSLEETAAIVDHLKLIKANCKGAIRLTDDSEALLDRIYKTWKGLNDVRFESYSNRRFTHLLKLCLIMCASRGARIISEPDVVLANTILTHTEHLMPKALGEFGKAKHSDVAHKIVQLLESENKPQPLKTIWKHVSNDLDKLADLATVLGNLATAEKIQQTPLGFLPLRKVLKEVSDGTVDFNLLTLEERKYRL